jgi:hypothetical protein
MRIPRVVAITAVVATAAACQLPSTPTRPSESPQLEIRGSTLLMVGGRGRLTAWAPRDGKLSEVRATWSTEDGDAVSLTSEGAVAGRRLGHSIVRASANGLTGTATVHVVADVAGKWRGSITVVDCWEPNGAATGTCEGRRGLIAPLLFDVTQSASADHLGNLRAVVEIFDPPARGNFFGIVDSTGYFFLDGYAQRQADSFTVEHVTLPWQLEGNRLLPFSLLGRGEDIIEVHLSLKVGSGTVSLNEFWRLSEMTR